jgi:ribonuclease R
MLRGVTIDSTTTRDMDDALYAEMDGDNVRLWIAITNVAAFVEVDGREDAGARERCVTQYYRGGSAQKSMLSPALSEGVCSLVPNKAKSVLAVELLIDATGSIADTIIRLDNMTSMAKLGYDEIPRALDGSHVWRRLLTDPLRAIHAATSRIFAARKARGSVAFSDPNAGVLSSEDGTIEAIAENEFVGCMMVQEAMIAANQAMARYAVMHDIPILYRNHEARIATPPRADVVAQFEQASILPTPHLSALIERVDVLLGRAQYDAHARGHYALCAPFYTHGTSPIRRYADLVTQRQLVAHLQGTRLPYAQETMVELAEHINGVLERTDVEQRERAKAKAIAMADARISRLGYRRLDETDFERAIRQLRAANLPPPPEFVEDIVRRISARTLAHRSAAYLLPSLSSSAVWEHVAAAVCTWFVEAPEDAVSALKISKDLGLWSTNVGHVESSKDPSRPMVSCVATLLDGDLVIAGPKCFASAQRLAWHRAVAAVVVHHLDGQVPNEWLESNLPMAPTRQSPQSKNAISKLVEMAQEFGRPTPTFTFEQEGPPHKPTFKCICTMDRLVEVGRGGDKQTAKCIAARAMLNKLTGLGEGARV